MTTNRARYDAGAPHAPATADTWAGAISDDVDALNEGDGLTDSERAAIDLDRVIFADLLTGSGLLGDTPEWTSHFGDFTKTATYTRASQASLATVDVGTSLLDAEATLVIDSSNSDIQPQIILAYLDDDNYAGVEVTPFFLRIFEVVDGSRNDLATEGANDWSNSGSERLYASIGNRGGMRVRAWRQSAPQRGILSTFDGIFTSSVRAGIGSTHLGGSDRPGASSVVFRSKEV